MQLDHIPKVTEEINFVKTKETTFINNQRRKQEICDIMILTIEYMLSCSYHYEPYIPYP